jgi:two-component system chemotaxis response regulator CheY
MHILLVDDSKTMRMLVQRAIRQAGFSGLTYTEAGDGADGLQQMKTATPDLVLSDWNMPNMSGIDFLRALRREQSELPFGFITSEGSEEIKEIAMGAGANFLLTKPFTPEDVQESLSPYMRGQ